MSLINGLPGPASWIPSEERWENFTKAEKQCVQTELESLRSPILASIRQKKTEALKRKKSERTILSFVFEKIVKSFARNYFRNANIQALRKPGSHSKTIPPLAKILKTLNVSSNFFTAKQRKYIENLTRFHLPQMAKARIGYELIEHLSNQVDTSLPKLSLMLEGENFTFVDGKELNHPIMVHATKMKAAHSILSNTKKFFNDNIKLSLSMFEKGKMFFHSNDPIKEHQEDAFSHDDFYVALGLSVDPKNFYRNYPEDVGSPTYNRDSAIATKGGNDIVRVETHMKMNEVLGVVGAYVQDLQQRCYQEQAKAQALVDRDSPYLHAEGYRSPYSHTDRIFKLEHHIEWGSVGPEHDEMKKDLAILREKTGHSTKLKQYYNGMVNGSIIFNIANEIEELKCLSKKVNLNEELKKEIASLDATFTSFQLKHDGLRRYMQGVGFSKWERIKTLMHILISPLYRFAAFRRFFIPYHLSNFQSHRLVRFLGPNEVLGMTNEFSYNEFEAYSHEKSKEIKARPMEIKFIAMSRVAYNKLQTATPAQINEFKIMAKSAQAKKLPIVIVDTYVTPERLR